MGVENSTKAFPLLGSDAAWPLLRVYAVLLGAALAYPWLLAGLYAAGRFAMAGGGGAAGWAGVSLFAAGVLAVPALAAATALFNDGRRGAVKDGAAIAARRVAHAVFAAPPLFTAMGVILMIAGVNGQDALVWSLLWVGLFAVLAHRHRRGAAAPAVVAPPTLLRVTHGVGAALLLLIFLILHLGNHFVGLWSPQAHKAVMSALRHWYRAAWLEPALLLVMALMVTTGLVLARRRTVSFTDVFGTLQTLTGAYLAAFIASHLTAVLILARWKEGLDTDWSYATSAPAGLFGDPWSVRLIPHYGLAVAFVALHLAGGARLVLVAHGVKAADASRLMYVMAGGGVLMAGAITSAMLGLHLANVRY